MSATRTIAVVLLIALLLVFLAIFIRMVMDATDDDSPYEK